MMLPQGKNNDIDTQVAYQHASVVPIQNFNGSINDNLSDINAIQF